LYNSATTIRLHFLIGFGVMLGSVWLADETLLHSQLVQATADAVVEDPPSNDPGTNFTVLIGSLNYLNGDRVEGRPTANMETAVENAWIHCGGPQRPAMEILQDYLKDPAAEARDVEGDAPQWDEDE
jgi:hypothetical protein